MSSLQKVMHPEWVEQMAPIESQVTAMGNFLRQENQSGNGYFPPGNAIFRAFQQPFSEVKVLIVGQDPYHTPGAAMGLSFSVPRGEKIPPSLQNIFKELHDDLGVQIPDHGDLTAWSEQGVMLLNRVLTVRPGEAASHKGKGWEEITEFAVQKLAQREKPLVAILWGAQAQTLKPLLADAAVIESAHPSPLSCYRGFSGSKPFSRANALLQQMGEQPVNWELALS